MLKVDKHIVPVGDVLQRCSTEFEELIQTRYLETTQQHQLNFLSQQLLLQCSSPNGRRYPAETVSHSLNIFLESRNAYRALRNTVSFGKTLKSYFGKLGNTGSKEECKHVIGFAIDEPPRTVSAIMIALLLEAPRICSKTVYSL